MKEGKIRMRHDGDSCLVVDTLVGTHWFEASFPIPKDKISSEDIESIERAVNKVVETLFQPKI